METRTSEIARVLAGRVEARLLELPTMPDAAARVLAMCQDGAADAARLSEVIHQDPAIASNVLRVANSPAYVGQQPCASLQQAVSRLGMQLVAEVATAASMRPRLELGGRRSGWADDLWRHSVTTAFFTKEIARSRRRNVETAFLCGLLHDVGKVVLLGSLTPADLGAPEAELVAALDEHHVSAGLLLAEEWRLPAPVVASIQWHHEPASAELHADVAMTVCFADQLSHHVAPGSLAPAPTEDELRGHDVLVGLNLYPDEVERLLALGGRAVEFAGGCS